MSSSPKMHRRFGELGNLVHITTDLFLAQMGITERLARNSKIIRARKLYGLENYTGQCGSGKCGGTVTFGDMCISSYHINHILIMIYLGESYGTTGARRAGQFNENWSLEFGNEGESAVGHDDPVHNADFMFNKVVICLLQVIKHKRP